MVVSQRAMNRALRKRGSGEDTRAFFRGTFYASSSRHGCSATLWTNKKLLEPKSGWRRVCGLQTLRLFGRGAGGAILTFNVRHQRSWAGFFCLASVVKSSHARKASVSSVPKLSTVQKHRENHQLNDNDWTGISQEAQEARGMQQRCAKRTQQILLRVAGSE